MRYAPKSKLPGAHRIRMPMNTVIILQSYQQHYYLIECNEQCSIGAIRNIVQLQQRSIKQTKNDKEGLNVERLLVTYSGVWNATK